MNQVVTGPLKALLKERDRLVKKLGGYKYLLRGTIVKRGNICGTPNCRCKRKNNPILHGPYDYLSHRSRSGINMIFLNKQKLFHARKGVAAYDELIDTAYKISEINFRILRYHHAQLKEGGFLE